MASTNRVDAARVHELLVNARELISDPEHWTQGMAERVYRSGGVSYCSLGALTKASTNGYYFSQAYIEMTAAIPGIQGIVTFNDTHTHEQVLAIFDKVIKKLNPMKRKHWWQRNKLTLAA